MDKRNVENSRLMNWTAEIGAVVVGTMGSHETSTEGDVLNGDGMTVSSMTGWEKPFNAFGVPPLSVSCLSSTIYFCGVQD